MRSRYVVIQRVSMTQRRSKLALSTILAGQQSTWANRSAVLLSPVGVLLARICWVRRQVEPDRFNLCG